MKTVAVIGCGRKTGQMEGHAIGHAHARAYQQEFPDAQLFGVDPNPDNLKAFGDQFGLPSSQLFPSTKELYAAVVPEVVSICTWPGWHHPQVLEAAGAGVKGIICEKPVALDGSEIEEMLKSCAYKKVQLAIAHQRRHDAPYVKARELIAAGALGSRMILEARVSRGWDILSWTVHWFDMANYLFDAAPEWVLAGMDHSGQRRYQHAVEDGSVILAQYPDNKQAIFVTGPDAPLGDQVTVRGETGWLVLTNAGVELWTEKGKTLHEATGSIGGYRGMAREMDAAIRTGAPMRCGADKSVLATRMAYAAHESARVRRKVFLPSPVQYAPLEILQHPPRRPTLSGKVVLLADGHHTDPETGESGRDGLADALRSLGAAVTVLKAEERELTAADLAEATALVLYHTQRKSSEATRHLLRQWVGEGRPLVISHCGIGAYPDWPEFRQWIGIYWVWGNEDPARASRHPHVACEIEVPDQNAFKTGWQQAWLPRDEVYTNLGTASEVKVLARTTVEGQSAPVAWQSLQHPNVVTWAPGHRSDIFRLSVTGDGLRAALVAAGVNQLQF